MIILSATTSTLQVVLDAAPATNQLPCSTAYADQGGNAAPTDVLTNGTTAVTIVPAPAAGVNRVVNSVSIYNADTAPRTVTVNKNDNGTLFTQIKVSLPPGYRLGYNAARGWGVTDASGNFLEAVQANQAGTWTVNIGSALPAGSNALGTVGVTSLPSIPAGSNAIGSVSVSNFPATQTVTGTVTANQGTTPWTIQGDVASGSTNAGNPVKMAGAFNTTQPTVTNGQVVDAQMSARGAQLVATGVDTFNVTVNVALPAGSATIGSVNQAGAPWSNNISQWGGSSTSLGQKLSASSLPVVIASDQTPIKQTGVATSIDGVIISTTSSSTFSNATVTKVLSVSVLLFNATISGGSVSVLIYDGSNTLRVSLQIPVPSSAVSPFIACDFQNLMLPLANSGSLPYVKLSANLTSGSLYAAISTG